MEASNVIEFPITTICKFRIWYCDMNHATDQQNTREIGPCRIHIIDDK